MTALRLCAAYAWREFLAVVAWRGFFLTLVVNQSIAPLIGLAVWRSVYPNDARISAYFVAVLLTQLITVSYEDHTLSNPIFDGSIADTMLRPSGIWPASIGSSLAYRGFHLVAGLPLVIGLMLWQGMDLTPVRIATYVGTVMLGATVRFLFTFTLACTAFWTTQAGSTVAFGNVLVFLLGGIAAPLSTFDGTVGTILRALPFYGMIGLPSDVLSGMVAPNRLMGALVLQAGWLAVLLLAARFAWETGSRRFAAVGG